MTGSNRAVWRRSSHSSNGTCVEAAAVDTDIAVRDSKLADVADFPRLTVSRHDWQDLLTTLAG